MSSAAAMPIVDLTKTRSDEDRRCAAAQRIGEAALDTGFFYISGHGLDAGCLAGAFAASRALFALPGDDKRSALMVRGESRGYEPLAYQQLDRSALNDHKESFQLAADDGRNRWPPSASAESRAALLAYHRAVCDVGTNVMRLLARSLRVADDAFDEPYRGANPTLRLLRYPARPGDGDPNRFGAGAHTDWGGISILAQDDAGGLEVQQADGSWLAAAPLEGTFVVNLGDLIVRWTNGRYRSTPHRVRYAETLRDRYSLALFFSPRADALIETVPTCVAPGERPHFASCTAGEHIEARRRETYGGSRA